MGTSGIDFTKEVEDELGKVLGHSCCFGRSGSVGRSNTGLHAVRNQDPAGIGNQVLRVPLIQAQSADGPAYSGYESRAAEGRGDREGHRSRQAWRKPAAKSPQLFRSQPSYAPSR